MTDDITVADDDQVKAEPVLVESHRWLDGGEQLRMADQLRRRVPIGLEADRVDAASEQEMIDVVERFIVRDAVLEDEDRARAKPALRSFSPWPLTLTSVS